MIVGLWAVKSAIDFLGKTLLATQMQACGMSDNPYKSPQEANLRRAAPSVGPAAREGSPSRRILWHFLVAFIVGPYLVGVVLFLSEETLYGDQHGLVITVFGPIYMLLFALPFTIPFSIFTLFPAFLIWKIKRRVVQFVTFALCGSIAGALIGLWASLPGTEFDNRVIVVPGTTLVGLVCGCVEALGSKRNYRPPTGGPDDERV